jgi:hypothetical protein
MIVIDVITVLAVVAKSKLDSIHIESQKSIECIRYSRVRGDYIVSLTTIRAPIIKMLELELPSI